MTQLLAQYPWLQVDKRGQVHLDPEYREWLEQQGAAKQSGAMNPAYGGAGVLSPNGAVAPDGGVGFVPPSALNVGAGTSLGVGGLGNGLQAGTAAHV